MLDYEEHGVNYKLNIFHIIPCFSEIPEEAFNASKYVHNSEIDYRYESRYKQHAKCHCTKYS